MRQVKTYRLFGLLSTIILGLISAISCTGVDYGYIDEGFGAPEGFGKCTISPKFEWNQATNGQAASLPDTMNVLLARKVDEIHYAWVVNSDFAPHKSTEQFRPVVSRGEYAVLAFYAPQDSYRKTPVAEFESNPRIPIMGYNATLLNMPAKELNEICGSFASEYGLGYNAVMQAGELWQASMIDFVANDTLKQMSLEPKLLTLTMDFKLRVKKEANVAVTAITAMFTGVPTSVNLMRGTVSASNKGKVIFKMGQDSGNSTQAVYSGRATTLGVLPIGQGSFAEGNCVLYLAIDVNVAGQERKIYTALNLRDRISGHQAMMPENRGLEYRLVRNHIDVHVHKQLILNGDKILSGVGNQVEWK